MSTASSTLNEALRGYGLADCDVVPVASSFNDVYRVTSRGRSFALRVGPVRRIHAVGEAAAESAWTRRVRAAGITAPGVVWTLHGEASLTVDGRQFMLLDWMAGRPMERPVTVEDAARMGMLCARLHDAVPVATTPPAGLLDARRVVLFDVPDRLAELRLRYGGLFDLARERALAAVERAFERCAVPALLHGDLTPDNVLRDGADLAFVDCQDLMWASYEQDLAHTLFGFRRDDVDGRLAEAFRGAYGSVRAWPGVDPGLLVARRLQLVNLALVLRRPGLDTYLERHAADLRD